MLDPGKVLLTLTSTGLNFRDVLNVLGMYPGDPGPPGQPRFHGLNMTTLTGIVRSPVLNLYGAA